MLLHILFLGLVFLALVGQGLAQTKTDKNEPEKKTLLSYFQNLQKKKPTNSSNSSGNSLLPFSWFRNKSEATTETNSSSAKPTVVSEATIATPQKNEPQIKTSPEQKIAKTLDDFSSDDLNVAPLPPDNPYYEQNRTLIAAKQNTYPVSISESIELPDLDTVPSSAQPNARLIVPDYSEEPLLTGLSSYSFDTRDWVESFPVDHVSDSSSPNQFGQSGLPNQKYPEYQELPANKPTLSATHVEQSAASNMASNTASNNIPTAQQNQTGINSKQWDGQAMPIAETIGAVANETKTVKLASISRSMPETQRRIEKELETTFSGIDLTPSYATRLKYCEVYGVVVVQSNFPLTEIKAILEEIKQLQADLNLYMGISAPKEKIELCLFRDERTYLKFLQEVFPKAPRDRRALYIKIDDKPGTLLVQKTDEFEIDLRHEMTHAIIHTSIATVPIWLDEGLAKYFEVPIKDRAEKNPYMKQIRWNTKFGAVPSLNRLERLEHIGQMGDREYRDSWAWVHFLIHHSPQSHRLLASYLQLLSTLSEEKPKNHDSAAVPPISLYLDEVVGGSREKYREHFQNRDIRAK
ncbi:MAG: hypothetical protein LBI18_16250 [Planctomycetaceae bacterium]|nr:hypothetical protein [Planctomycetaceae bacterium]